MEQSEKKAFPKLRLVYAIIILIAGGLILANSIVIIFYLKPFVTGLKEDFLNFEFIQAERISYITENFVDQIVKNSKEIATSIGIVGGESKEAEIILGTFLRNNPEVEILSIINSSGQEIKKSSVSQFFSIADLKNLFFSEEFNSAIKGETFISQVFFSEKAEPYIIIATPIFASDQQKIIGVLRIELSLRGIWRLVSEMEVGKTGRVSIVDNKGNLIADPDSSRVLKGVNLLHLAPVKAIIQGKEFKDLKEGKYVDEKGKEVIGVGVPIKNLGWGVIVEQSTEEVLGAGQRLETFAIIFVLISILIIAILGWMARILGRTNRELIQRYNQLEFQMKELDKTAKILVRRDFELSETREKREAELKKLAESRVALMNILEDVNESREKAEEEKNKTLAIITNFADGLLVFDKEGKLSLINPQAESFFTVKSSDVIGRTILELKKYPTIEPIVEIVGEEIKGVFRKEVQIREDLVLEVSTIPIMREREKLGILMILHDVTREKMIERMKTEFVSISAHQLRTPLSAIKWTLRMLLDGDLGKITKEQREFLDKTYRSNERMIGLINDLLNVTRIEEGRYLYQPVLTDLEPVVQSVINSYKEEIEKRKIKFEFKKPEKKLPKVLIDVENMKIAISDLLDNAIRYTPAGGIVTISLNCGKKEIEVWVKDSGIGIPKGQQDRVFTKFFRGANAVKMETEGTGLGLYITKNIIEAHGGKIWFESEEGKGTTFYFTIPIKEEFRE